MAPKTKLTAKAVLTDLKSGLSDDDLMRKYRISARGLQSLFVKMVKAGILEQYEIDARTNPREITDQSGIQSQKLAQLKDALESGILSKEEFERKKAELGIASGSPRIEPPRSQARPLSNDQRDGGKTSTPEEGQEPWYQTPIGIMVLVTCFFPVGLYLLWRSEKFTPKTKKIITGVWAGLLLIGMLTPSQESTRNRTQPTPSTATRPPEPARTVKEEPKPVKETQQTGEVPPPIPFPVTFQKGESQDTREFLAKILRASIIAGKDPADLEYCGRVTVHNNCFEKTLEQVLKAESQCERTKSKKSGMVECPDAYWLRQALSGMWADKLGTLNNHKIALRSIRATDPTTTAALKYTVTCPDVVRDLGRFAESVTDEALVERKNYWAAVKKREAIIQAKREETYRRYVQEIRSGKRPVKSFEDAKIKFASVDGTEYVDRPPTSVPSDDRYLHFSGTIETQEGATIICNKESLYDSENFKIRKWAFRSGISSYAPRINERVEVIGKISDVLKGTTVVGKTIYMVVVDAVAIEDADGKLHQR